MARSNHTDRRSQTPMLTVGFGLLLLLAAAVAPAAADCIEEINGEFSSPACVGHQPGDPCLIGGVRGECVAVDPHIPDTLCGCEIQDVVEIPIPFGLALFGDALDEAAEPTPSERSPRPRSIPTGKLPRAETSPPTPAAWPPASPSDPRAVLNRDAAGRRSRRHLEPSAQRSGRGVGIFQLSRE